MTREVRRRLLGSARQHDDELGYLRRRRYYLITAPTYNKPGREVHYVRHDLDNDQWGGGAHFPWDEQAQATDEDLATLPHCYQCFLRHRPRTCPTCGQPWEWK